MCNCPEHCGGSGEAHESSEIVCCDCKNGMTTNKPTGEASSDWDDQQDVEMEGQRAAIYHAKKNKPPDPDIETQIAELRAAGWVPAKRRRSYWRPSDRVTTTWLSPNKQVYRGPHGAWLAMKRRPQ